MQRPVRRAPEPHGAIRAFSSISGTCRSVIAGLVWGALVASAAALPAPGLSCDYPEKDGQRISDDGTVDLTWILPDSAEAATYELQQSSDERFTVIDPRYAGPNTASVLSGLREGDYHFRVRAVSATGEAGPWSDTLTLHVEFMDHGTLFALLGTGFVVATLTIGAIVVGFLKTK